MVSGRVVGLSVLFASAAAAFSIQVGAQTENYRAVQRAPVIKVVQPDLTVTVQRPMNKPAGLAWRPSIGPHGQLWISDIEARKVVMVSPGTGKSAEYAISGEVAPGPVAFDGLRDRLWTIDRSRNEMIRDLNRGEDPEAPQAVFQPFDRIAIPDTPHRAPIRGFAVDPTRDQTVDGEIVWTCRGGGLCSTIELKNLVTDKVLAQFFPRCEPIDIAIDSNGERLWILADNGEGRSAVLIERRLTGSTGRRPQGEADLASRRFLALPPDIRPTAIAATDDAVWVLTRKDDSWFGRLTDKPNLFKFNVGRLPPDGGGGGDP